MMDRKYSISIVKPCALQRDSIMQSVNVFFREARSIWRGVLCVLVISALSGCQTTLMPTPIVFDDNVDPFAHTPNDIRTTTSEVFIVTDRKPSGKQEPASFYSKKRDEALWIALAEVDLGKSMSWEELREQSLTSHRSMKPNIGLVSLDQYGALWKEIPTHPTNEFTDEQVTRAFLDAVQAKLDRSLRKEIFIFVHGFNTAVDDNTELAAELFHYLGDDGVFMSYEWPSRHSVFDYSKDKANARYSTRYFRLLLEFLAEHTQAERINILAHSAGAPVAVEAVRELRLMLVHEDASNIQRHYRIGHLVLFAPDMDLAQFVNAEHDGLHLIAESISIYISTSDKALNFSAWVYGFARLGEPLKALRPKDLENLRHIANLEVIDVAAAEKNHGSFLGHSYFHEDPWVSSDMIMLLRHGATPEERGLTRPDDNPIWGFPPDYPQRARAAARKLYEP